MAPETYWTLLAAIEHPLVLSVTSHLRMPQDAKGTAIAEQKSRSEEVLIQIKENPAKLS